MKPNPVFKLIPLKPEQHPVTHTPKFTTELPFFYLTKDKKLLSQVIVYEDVDGEGRPIRWKVRPHLDPEIGAPAIEAHEVWTRLIKPAIDSNRKLDGQLPAIIRLGRVRECLRIIGWRAGGWEARDLLRCIQQICFAACEADFWLPTSEHDEKGTPLYRRIKSSFTRMSLYAIGSQHLTEADLKSSGYNFDFDLEDTMYVQLHPIEVEIQRFQLQQPLDNEYLFSVSPTARRSYELLAPKIFGVVKNSSGFCEFRYAWYVKRHPTLTRSYEHKYVTRQMKRVLGDHLASGYIKSFEVRPIKEPNQELDFIIRIYPGGEVKESIKRIQAHRQKKKFKVINQTTAPASSVAATAEQGSDPQLELTGRSEKELHLIRQLNEQFGVIILKASELVEKFPEETERQLEAYTHRTPAENPAGFIITAIEQKFSTPQSYDEATGKAEDRARYEARQATIAACTYCRDNNGWRFTDKGARECTHNPDIEAKLPTK